MAPGQQPVEDVNYLRTRLAEVEGELHRQRARLTTGEERFRALADALPVMIWMSGRDKLCTYFNQPWLAFTGQPLDRQIGNGLQESGRWFAKHHKGSTAGPKCISVVTAGSLSIPPTSAKLSSKNPEIAHWTTKWSRRRERDYSETGK